ncbi:unnamed protein product, partial [Ascophyllum nodosum]
MKQLRERLGATNDGVRRELLGFLQASSKMTFAIRAHVFDAQEAACVTSTRKTWLIALDVSLGDRVQGWWYICFFTWSRCCAIMVFSQTRPSGRRGINVTSVPISQDQDDFPPSITC